MLKGFAVFLIIPIHILETFIDYPGRESTIGKVLLFLGGPVAVPVFMMVMGYFVAVSNKSTRENIVRGVKIFILGFLLNIGLNFNLLMKIKFSGWQIEPLQYIFGVDIFYLAGLSIIILSVIKSLNRGQQWITFGLILFVSVTSSYFNNLLLGAKSNYILPFIGGEYSWSYFPIFPWLSYPLIGFLFQKTENPLLGFFNRKKAVSVVILTVIFINVALFSQFGVETTIALNKYYHHTFLFFLWVLGVDILWILLIWYVDRKFSEFPIIVFLKWLGKNITAFYVIQWLIIGNIATNIFQTQKLSQFGIWYGAIFLVTLGITLIYENIRNKYAF